MSRFVMIIASTGRLWEEEDRFNLILDHTPGSGEMFYYEGNVYQVVGLRTDCTKDREGVMQVQAYCYVQKIKSGAKPVQEDLYEKFDKAMDDYKKIKDELPKPVEVKK